ncbi:MAG: glycosyltransferase family 4 protein [Magnetococcales bacterium]|nr:glycosyltransferase family 4 protein [Magnetococcales bacterium]NGZ05990.1 glycosyltransferase family 4 protein [Magnetococcales bacterium]
MKISIGARIQPGPWGGGNRFCAVLSDALQQTGHTVTYDLTDDDLDAILLIEPDRRLRISAYDHADILWYLLRVNPRCVVVHRINNTSEARQDPRKTFNHMRIQANRVADHTVFVSQWVRDCYQESGFDRNEVSVIHNGADHTLWSPGDHPRPPGPLRLVTHHWSKNLNKGWDLYQQLDHLLGQPEWAERFAFTFVGSLPDGMTLTNSRMVPPLNGTPLVEELRRHDIYLTASRFEAGPNHVLEGALCGLPLLYLESGAMAEYTQGFGLSYTPETLETALIRMAHEYPMWQKRMALYPFTAQRMCQHYLDLLCQLTNRREELMKKRRFWSSWPWVARTLWRRGQ